MIKKKGASRHLEMIISFLLFFAFVFFLLVYIRPYESSSLSDSIVFNLHNSFESNVSVDLTTIFLKKDSSVSGCFSFEVPGNAEGNSFVRTATSEQGVPSGFSGGVVSIDPDEVDEDYFYVFISPEFEEGALSCKPIAKENYVIGSIEKSVLISDKYLKELKDNYENRYDSLKEHFRIPSIVDFSIRSIDGEYSLTMGIPENVDVSGKVYVYRVLYSDGSIKNKEFIFSIW